MPKIPLEIGYWHFLGAKKFRGRILMENKKVAMRISTGSRGSIDFESTKLNLNTFRHSKTNIRTKMK